MHLEEAREIFVRAIPPEDQDWITKSATFISQAISSSTSMLLKGLTNATSYYISHSTPSPHASGSQTPKETKDPNAPPPRALLLLSSNTPSRHGCEKGIDLFAGELGQCRGFLPLAEADLAAVEADMAMER
ncbi:hypothetical protein NUW54_g14408 [Trametes sanguinea]|uniref:Uncharacterized protein n=1 Tax=Trametes sanguinea TaxID=158606 RepID=A0ACC1MDF3_9APHY|nr:hypothetical protein NUW54_g14408 [Trametes sanguinea]